MKGIKVIEEDKKVQDHRDLLDWSIYNNNESKSELPVNMRFNEGHKLSIIVYSILLVFSAVANITVLKLLFKRRAKNPSKINTLLIHLAIADLLVTFLMMPLEIGWAATVEWIAGDAMCRIMAFFRTFGLFLSSFILVCISLNRFYAVIKPLQVVLVQRREKIMLAGAWIGAMVCSFPQMIIFHVESHPNVTSYKQCVAYNIFPSYTHELLYVFFGMAMMYALPLAVIIYSYASILKVIIHKTRNPVGAYNNTNRSSGPILDKAKIRTLKMTVLIVVVFFICWTPYHVMCFWYWLHRESALKVDQRIQRGLFLFACTNSCMNPVVYGIFNIRTERPNWHFSNSPHQPPQPNNTTTRLSAIQISLTSLE